MAAIVRGVVAIAAALVVIFILVVAVEFFSAVVHPVPADFDGSMEEMCRHVERYPAWVLAVVVPLWAGTAFAGTWVAGRLANRGCALFIAFLLLASLVLNISMLPYPYWFETAALIGISAGIWLGLKWSRPPLAIA